MARKPHKVGVIIAAGGSGKRLGGNTPKQFLLLNGTSILARTVHVFDELRGVTEIVLVAPRSYLKKTQDIVTRAKFTKVTNIVAGGAERQDSVRNGLHAFNGEPDIVLVHDAVRPMVVSATVKDIIKEARKHRAAVVGVRVKDTIKLEETPGFYRSTLDRRKLWAVQTPQGFAYKVLLRAHETAHKDKFLGTDESSLVERLGIPVRIVEGDDHNIKITTVADLKMAEGFLAQKKR